MLVTNKEIMSTAVNESYGVGAFNINNLETILAIAEVAMEEKSPVIIAATPSIPSMYNNSGASCANTLMSLFGTNIQIIKQ